jgi:hypothetical protein
MSADSSKSDRRAGFDLVDRRKLGWSVEDGAAVCLLGAGKIGTVGELSISMTGSPPVEFISKITAAFITGLLVLGGI